MHIQKDSNPEMSKKFKRMFEGMRDARKLFRLFKTLVEYQKVLNLLKQSGSDPKVILSILSRASFGCYWVFDNLSILSKIKFLENVDTKKASQRAARFWFFGLIFGIAVTFVQLYELLNEEKQLTHQFKALKQQNATQADKSQQQLSQK
mmetsp:Transcript_30100/g.22357  ORF Transcript_30100/g.22357 Transcript_30100/m.22357 type:complete len:149 (+) Transcript_30100:101-547(+)